MQFVSNHAYYQYFLQALTPAPTFTLTLLVVDLINYAKTNSHINLTMTSRRCPNIVYYFANFCAENIFSNLAYSIEALRLTLS